MKSPFNSISQLLLFCLFAAVLLHMFLGHLVGHQHVKDEIADVFDAQLRHHANFLLRLLPVNLPQPSDAGAVVISWEGEEPELEESDDRRNEYLFYSRKLAYQVYDENSVLLLRSESAPVTALTEMKSGLKAISLNNTTWFVYSLFDPERRIWLHVAESEEIRDEIFRDITEGSLLPGVIIVLPFMLYLMAYIVRRVLAPLKHLSNDIRRRDSYSLDMIKEHGSKDELKPVIQEINGLMIRVKQALQREQQLTADVAHELRTPLSVVLIHAQNALAATEERDRNIALEKLEQGIQRIARLLEQLLTLHKINPETLQLQPTPVHRICVDVIEQLAPRIYEENKEIEYFQPVNECHINGNVFLLEIVLRNLIDNAFRYSPKNGLIRLTVERQQEQVVIMVEDSGTGVSEQQYEKITQRFYRATTDDNSAGVGLGLALVKDIIEFHQASMHFSRSELGGLKVTLVFAAC